MFAVLLASLALALLLLTFSAATLTSIQHTALMSVLNTIGLLCSEKKKKKKKKKHSKHQTVRRENFFLQGVRAALIVQRTRWALIAQPATYSNALDPT
jgi:hypothetical protein